jgi:transcription antitermination factor NusG
MFDDYFYPNCSWYAMLVRMGKEQTIKQNILKSKKLKIDDIVIPEPINSMVEENDEEAKYKILLGYIFIKLKLDVDSYQELLEIESVYRFLGVVKVKTRLISNTRYMIFIPHRIVERQIVNLKKFLNGDKKETKEKRNEFNVGDEIEIISGDLASICGVIKEISDSYAYITPLKFFTQTIKVPLKKIIHKVA